MTRNWAAAMLLSWLFPSLLMAAEKGNNFYTLTTQDGLSSNCVLQMLQLNDGYLRRAFT